MDMSYGWELFRKFVQSFIPSPTSLLLLTLTYPPHPNSFLLLVSLSHSIPLSPFLFMVHIFLIPSSSSSDRPITALNRSTLTLLCQLNSEARRHIQYRSCTDDIFFITLTVYRIQCRIVIYVPRRIKTIHHHHHHVVVMDPDQKTMMVAKPYAKKYQPPQSSGEGYQEDHLQQYAQHLHKVQQQRQHRMHQSTAAGSHPLSYVEQRKTVAAGPHDSSAIMYPMSQLPYAHVPSAHSMWPVSSVRDKRSKRIFARLVTTYDS